jgi:SAM-dependent methyltransferase
VSAADADAERAEMLSRWERAAAGWERRADRTREAGMPVSAWMIEHLALQPGQDVLELAAGPGDTGFLAAELIEPGGTLICSDAAEAMLDVARGRARRLGVDNVEFKRLELEWIDLPTASIDAILCRWALMLILDPAAALQEARRVLRPGGKIALAVWDQSASNPWATIPGRALVELGHTSPPDPNAPGMFALAAPGQLAEMLEAAGFLEVETESIELDREYEDVGRYVAETLDLSRIFSDIFTPLAENEQAEVKRRIGSLAAEFTAGDGTIRLPGRSIVAAAHG